MMKSETNPPARARSRAAIPPALAVVGAFVLAIVGHGCATTQEPLSEINTDREYRTGSNIPVRDRSARSDAQSVDPTAVQDALQRSGPRNPVIKGSN